MLTGDSSKCRVFQEGVLDSETRFCVKHGSAVLVQWLGENKERQAFELLHGYSGDRLDQLKVSESQNLG